jgi:EspA/EspE family
MPQQTDVAKGPLEILGGAKAWAKGDYEKGVLAIVNAGGFAGFAIGRYFASDATKKAFGQELEWLWRGIIFIMFLQMLLGPATDNGQKYKSAKKDFQLAYKSLEAAIATDSGWASTGADAYNEQNDRQMTRADTIAELDAQIAVILATESDQVKRTALNLNWEQAALTALIPICHVLNKTQPEVSQSIQVCAFFAAVDAGVAIISWMCEMSSRNRRDVDDLMEKYRQVADEAEASLRALLDDATVGTFTPTTKSTVGQFDTLTTAAPLVAPLAAPAAVPDSPDEPASRVVGADNAGDGGSPAEPAVGESPAYAVPTMSQVVGRASQASTQAAQFSENASVTVGLVSDTVGVVDQVNSMAQPTAPAPAAPAGAAAAPVPAQQAAVTEDDAVAEDGAAAGAEGAERAPVDVAAGGTGQAQEPNPGERIL